jgi:hypothetical protein
MRFARWSALALAAVVLLGITGCVEDSEDLQFSHALGDLKSVPGVAAVIHSSIPLREATIVVAPGLSAAGMMSVRDRVSTLLAHDGLGTDDLHLRLQSGHDRISLTATDGAYRFLQQWAHRAPAIGVHLIVGPTDTDSTGGSRVTVIVASKTDLLAGFALAQSAAADSATVGELATAASVTPDGNYQISLLTGSDQPSLIAVSSVLIADHRLIGMVTGPGILETDTAVTIGIRSQSDVAAAYNRYSSEFAKLPGSELQGIDAPRLKLTLIDGDIPPAATIDALRMALATGAVSGEVDLGDDTSDGSSLEFVTSSPAEVKTLNALARRHPEFRNLAGFMVFLEHDNGTHEEWNFGKPVSG